MTDTVVSNGGEHTAIVDTIEDSLAPVFFEYDGEDIGSVIIDAETLLEAARHVDAILTVTITAGEFSQLTYEPDRTETRT